MSKEKFSILKIRVMGLSLLCAMATLSFLDLGARNSSDNLSGNVQESKPAGNTEKVEVKAEEGQITSFPGFVIDLKAQEVKMDAKIALDEGILEYLLCTPASFDHESVFVTEAKPELLHASLLFIGMEPDARFLQLGSIIWDLTGERPNCVMKIYVEYEEGGQDVRIELDHLLYNREGDEEDRLFPEDREENSYWVFTGSFFFKSGEENVYAANENGGIVAIWPNPSCVIQYGHSLENPYQGEDRGMEINTEFCPPAGTPVKLVFKPYDLPLKKKPEVEKDAPKQGESEKSEK